MDKESEFRDDDGSEPGTRDLLMRVIYWSTVIIRQEPDTAI